MHNLKKAAAVALMVGGIGLVGSGVASANGTDGPYVDNVQVVDCDQEFNAAGPFTPAVGAATGDQETNIGNFCTVVGHDED